MRISDWSSDVCSSDLDQGTGASAAARKGGPRGGGDAVEGRTDRGIQADHRRGARRTEADAEPARTERAGKGACRRSEEHTSELQSLMRISYAVFCLKKTTMKRA